MMYDNRVKGSIIRSRIMGYEHADRPSSYFLNLENSKQSKKSIYKIRAANGNIIDTKKEILEEISSYYTHLYSGKNSYVTSSDEIKRAFMPNESHVKLNQEQKDSCEGIITKEELTEVLKNTKNNKSPGIDGIPYEFYKMFWNDISMYFNIRLT